jgi:hypothetical protein
MINWKGLVILAVMMVLSGVAAYVRADNANKHGDKPFNFEVSGALQPSEYQFPDGNSTVYITDQGKSNFGPITIYQWVAAVADGKTCTPPSGLPNAGSERTFQDALTVIRFEKTGDLLFSDLVSGTLCVDLTPGVPPFSFQGVIDASLTGGTGRFAGVSGTYTENSGGQFLSCTLGSGPCIGYGLKMVKGGTIKFPVIR